jgi:hypothetical protein
MIQTYNQIAIFGNERLKSTVAKVVERSNLFKSNFPDQYAEQLVSEVFYGMTYLKFQNSNLDSTTKKLRTEAIELNEFIFVSDARPPHEFQKYLTQKLSTVDPCVLVVNSFHNAEVSSGELYTVCRDASKGDFSVCSVSIDCDVDDLSQITQKFKKLEAQINWSLLDVRQGVMSNA